MKYVTPEESQYYIKLSPYRMHKATAFTRIPGDDGWDNVYYLTDAFMDASGAVRKIEYVYVLINKSMPGMVKIGMTTNTPDERAREISKATGVPTPWMCVYFFKCYRSDLLEQEVHEYLSEYRVNTHREMFNIDSYTAQQAIESLGNNYSSILHADSILI